VSSGRRAAGLDPGDPLEGLDAGRLVLVAQAVPEREAVDQVRGLAQGQRDAEP
jgi:hypothetical protein